MRFKHYGVISEITDFPGCGQIGVFHATFIPAAERGHGLGSIAHQARLEEAKHLGYDVVTCTVLASNIAQKKILEKFNWSKLMEFMSSRSDQVIELWGKSL